MDLPPEFTVYGAQVGGAAAQLAAALRQHLPAEAKQRACVVLEVAAPDRLKLLFVEVVRGRRGGLGAAILGTACVLADRFGVTLALTARRDRAAKRGVLPQADLEAWYRRYGFVDGARHSTGALDMTRLPGAPLRPRRSGARARALADRLEPAAEARPPAPSLPPGLR